jgi:hypothetical protein
MGGQVQGVAIHACCLQQCLPVHSLILCIVWLVYDSSGFGS